MKYVKKKKKKVLLTKAYVAFNMPTKFSVNSEEQHRAKVSNQTSFHYESLLNS